MKVEKYIIIKTTTDSIDNANLISEELHKHKLSPCITIKSCQSNYIWDNELKKEKQFNVEIKTKLNKTKKIIDIISTIHSHECPEIISTEFIILNDKYKDWFDRECP